MPGDGCVYEVFLSYASPDRSFAEDLDRRLRDKGLRTFFDRRELRAGSLWLLDLEEAIRRAGAVAVLVGAHGLGSVQQYERGLALARQAEERAFPIVPVLVPGCLTPPPGFLQLLTWVDLREGLERSAELDRLLVAVRGEAVSSAPIRECVCPYMGLEPFREEDAPFYCGRDKAVADLVAAVGKHSLVAVVGRSGSGKSSLVLAGLLPGSDLDAKELAAILSAGLSVLVVQHVRKPGWNPGQHSGETDAQTAVEFARAAGYAAGSHVFLDLEGISGTASDTRIFAESWAATIAAGGYRAGCYVGYDVPLDAQELYALHTINSYWSDAGNRAVATRGFALKQHQTIRIGGVPFDPDTVQVDMLGDTPMWTAPGLMDIA